MLLSCLLLELSAEELISVLFVGGSGVKQCLCERKSLVSFRHRWRVICSAGLRSCLRS